MMGRTAEAWLVRAGVLSVALLTFIVPSSAAEFASGDQIRATIIGNSLEGIWTDNSRFAEYYDPNGTFRGYAYAPHRTRYAGTWKITGNQMCTRWTLVETGATYSECYQYVVSPGTVSLYRKGRSIGVTATVRPGNPNRY